MAAISEMYSPLVCLILTITFCVINGLPTPVVTSLQTSTLYSDIQHRLSQLSQETKLLTERIESLGDVGSCFQHSTLEEIRLSLENISSCSDTVVESTTATVLAKLEKMFDVLGHNTAYPEDITNRLVTMALHTRHTLNALIIETNMTSPNVTIGMICQGIPTGNTFTMLKELVSIMKETKNAFDSMIGVLSRNY